MLVAAGVCEWQPIGSAPFGMKCLLLTYYGIAVIGVCPRDPKTRQGYVAWAPLPKKPAWLKTNEITLVEDS